MTKWTSLCLVMSVLSAASAEASGPLDHAVVLLENGANEAAATELKRIVAANPWEGMASYYLGVALARSGRCREAMDQFDNALALGANGDRNGMRSAHLRAAECLAAIGDLIGSSIRLHEAWAHWSAYDIPSLTSGNTYDPVRDHGLLLPLTGRTAVADSGGLVDRMRADLAYFDTLVRETHPDPFHQLEESEWARAVAFVDARIPGLTPQEFNIELMRLGAQVGDGHTSVFPTAAGGNAWRLLPFYPLRLADGWAIAAAAPAQSGLVGARIDSIGGVAIDSVVADIDALVSGDNEMTVRWLAGAAMQCYETYEALGIAGKNDTVSFDVTLASGKRRLASLAARPIDRDPNARWAPDDWPDVGDGTLWLGDPSRPFSMHWIDKQQVLYVQLNQILDGEVQSLVGFGKTVLGELRRRSARGLVLDLRHNNGGNTALSYPFLRSIARCEQLDAPGSIVALIGPRTFSAAMDLAGRLERDMGALFVGWPTGGRPNGYSTERPFTLPYSGISGTISARWHQDGMGGDDYRPWIAPDIAAWPTRADVESDSDPVLSAALRLIAAR